MPFVSPSKYWNCLRRLGNQLTTPLREAYGFVELFSGAAWTSRCMRTSGVNTASFDIAYANPNRKLGSSDCMDLCSPAGFGFLRSNFRITVGYKWCPNSPWVQKDGTSIDGGKRVKFCLHSLKSLSLGVSKACPPHYSQLPIWSLSWCVHPSSWCQLAHINGPRGTHMVALMCLLLL